MRYLCHVQMGRINDAVPDGIHVQCRGRLWCRVGQRHEADGPGGRLARLVDERGHGRDGGHGPPHDGRRRGLRRAAG